MLNVFSECVLITTKWHQERGANINAGKDKAMARQTCEKSPGSVLCTACCTVFSNQITSKTRGAILLTSSVLVLKIEVTSLRVEYQFFFCDITIVDI